MEFYEILTKTERDISKNCNFALSPLFPLHFTRNQTYENIVENGKQKKTTKPRGP